jgi:hypothetical protein
LQRLKFINNTKNNNNSNAPDSYSGDMDRILDATSDILSEIFVAFPQSLQANAG